MGRKRNHDRHLPERVYLRSGTYWLVADTGKWIKLARDYPAALHKLAEILGQSHVQASMGAVIDRYESEILPQRSKSTQINASYILKRLKLVFGHMRPEEIATRHVIEYRDLRGKKAKTAANRDLEVLSTLFRHAIEWGLANSNPVRDVRHFEERPRDVYVTDADFFSVYEKAPEALQIAMDLALLTGQRRGDLLSLTWGQVTKSGLVFKQAKTGKKLIVEWSPELRQVVDRAKDKHPTHVIGRKLGPAGFQSLWRRTIAKVVKERPEFEPFNFHDLRAKSASDDTELSRASARLGHTDARVTKRVYRRLPERVLPLSKECIAPHKTST